MGTEAIVDLDKVLEELKPFARISRRVRQFNVAADMHSNLGTTQPENSSMRLIAPDLDAEEYQNAAKLGFREAVRKGHMTHEQDSLDVILDNLRSGGKLAKQIKQFQDIAEIHSIRPDFPSFSEVSELGADLTADQYLRAVKFGETLFDSNLERRRQELLTL